MSVMRQRKGDGVFLVFDLGGGTLILLRREHLAVASLLAHGGVAMCGGTDFDRAILDNVVKLWLLSNFDLPDDFSAKRRHAAHAECVFGPLKRQKSKSFMKNNGNQPDRVRPRCYG